MNDDKKECEECGTLNSVDSVKCKNCGCDLQNQGLEEDEYAILNALQQISRVGSSRAKNIVKAGYSDVDDLDDINIESITSIKGIGESVASDIVKTIEETKKQGGLYLCEECGAFVGEDTERCSNCGALMEDVEEDTETEYESVDEEIEEAQVEGDSSLYLCSNCGSFVSADSEVCKYCGASMEGLEEENEETLDDVDKGEDGGLFLCTNCGAFVSVESTECPSCGFTFTEDVEEEISETVEEEELEMMEEVEPKSESVKDSISEVSEEEIDDIEEQLDEGVDEGLEPESLDDLIGEVSDKDVHHNLLEEQTVEEMKGEKEWELEEELQISTDDVESDKVDESVDEEILQPEIAASTVQALTVGDDVKICGNCGYITDSSVEECSLCGYVFSEETVEMESEESSPIDAEDHSLDEDVDTIRKALGLSEEIDEDVETTSEDVLSRDDDEVDICTVCGAFLGSKIDRCPVCGSFTSETPDLDEIEEEPHIDYTDGDFSICDACGAFVKDGKKRCSICGSDMELAKKRIEEEEISSIEEDSGEVLEKFIGQRIDESQEDIEEDELEIYLCTSCGALVSSDAQTCPICHADVSDSESGTPEEYGHQEIAEDINEEGTSVNETQEEKYLEEPREEIEEGEYTEPDIIEDDSITSEKLSEEIIGEDDEELDIKLNEEIESILNEYEGGSENEEIEQTWDEESQAEMDVKDTELESVLEEMKEEGLEKAESSDEEDEWLRCPICNSHVSVDSDYCSICEHPLDEIGRGQEVSTKETVVSKVPERTEKTESERSIILKTKQTDKKTVSEPDFVESHVTSNIKNVLDRAKDYQVPVSSLSLLAFGGIYLTTYRTSDFSYFGEIGLILIGLFFSLGILTVFIFKDELVSHSYLGFIGYITGIVISSLVPIGRYILHLNIPLLASAGMIAIALGIFWILDYKLPENFGYYMLWFSGISILFVSGLTLILYPVQISNLEYSIILPLGLGSVMVTGGTAMWYRRAYEVYEGSPSVTSKRFSNYQNPSSYFEDVSKTCPVSEEKAIPYYSKGIASCSMGEYEDAVGKFKKALEIEGDNEAIWNNLGTAYSRLGDQERAKNCLKNAISLNEEYAIAWNNLGNTNFRCGDYPEALECYDKALEIEKNYRDAMLNKSQALIKLSKVGES